jgi:GNAT superfamily N-acetyltransferase
MIETALERDGSAILAISRGVGVFTSEEVDCVAELWQDYLGQGAEASGYDFIVYRDGDQVLGFACYGPRALTVGTYDLYWIAVARNLQGRGVGQALIRQVEENIRSLGGRLVFVETSGLEKYTPTRKFYLSTGYDQAATIRDFYRVGDDLVIFTKHLNRA